LQLLRAGGNGKSGQYFSKLIGYVKDEYLIIKIPVEHGAPVLLRDGEQLTVRVFSGVNVCSFTAPIERIFLHPCFYFHLAFPKAIQGTSLRKAMRIKVDIPGKFTQTGSDEAAIVTPVLLSNLSVSGALVESEQELAQMSGTVNLSFMLTMQPGNTEASVNANGIIRNTGMRKAEKPDQHDAYVCGIEFVDLDPTQQMMLQILTYEALAGDRQKIV
jgi:c-di-GMP-binding flagellar brake protein YcgR